MRIKLFVFLIFLQSTTSLFANSVKPYIYTPEDSEETLLSVTQTTGGVNFNSLISEYTTSSSKVFLPINSAADDSKKKYSIVSFPTEIAENSNDSYLRITLEVTTTNGDTYYLNAAHKDQDAETYRVIPFTRSTTAFGGIPDPNPSNSSNPDFHVFTSSVSEQQTTAYLNIKEICEGDCDLTNSQKSIKVYFFLTLDDPLAMNNNISTGDYSMGTTIEFFLSDKVPSYSTTIKELRKGDKRLIANILSANINDSYRTMTFFKKGSTGEAPSLDSYTAVLADGYSKGELFPFTYSGDVTFDKLTNGVDYSFIVSLVNKYQYGTKASNSVTGKPESIQTFIQQQQCYLLSAGFQEEHYVINYFKMVRDNYLLKNFFGKKFVQFYYWSAPHFTRYIYESSTLSTFFRGIGYSLYFIFHHFLWAITAILILLTTLFWHRDSKRTI